MSDTLYDFATKLQILLEGVKRDEVNRMNISVRRAIENAETALRQTKATKLNDLNARELNKLIARLQHNYDILLTNGVNKLLKAGEQLSIWQQGFEAKALDKGLSKSAKKAGKSIKQVAKTSLWKRVLQRPIQAVGKLLESFLDDWKSSEVKAVEGVLRNGWAQGQTIDAMTQKLRGTVKTKRKDGHEELTRRHAEAVVRTGIQQVSTATRATLYEENGDLIEKYKFVATLDRDTTLICRSLDLREFPLNNGPMPPMHINCRSTTIPVLGAEFDFLDEGALRSSEKGYVSAEKSFYEWLKEQPESVQVEVLGRSRAKMFREGGMSAKEFAEAQVDKNFRPISVEDLKRGAFKNLFQDE